MMEHYSVHLDQYISLTSSSSGNFLTPWNIFSAAVLLINHGVWLKQAPGSRASGPGRVGSATLLAPAVLGMEAGSHWGCSKGRWGELGAVLGTVFTRTGQILCSSPCEQHCGTAQPHWCALCAQHRGPSLTPSTTRSGTWSSCFGLFAN